MILARQVRRRSCWILVAENDDDGDDDTGDDDGDDDDNDDGNDADAAADDVDEKDGDDDVSVGGIVDSTSSTWGPGCGHFTFPPFAVNNRQSLIHKLSIIHPLSIH